MAMNTPSSPAAVLNKRFMMWRGNGYHREPVPGTIVQCVAYSGNDPLTFVAQWKGEHGDAGRTMEWAHVEPIAERIPLFR